MPKIPALLLIVVCPQLQCRHSCQNNCSDPYCVVRTVCLVCTHELIMTLSMVISGIIVFDGQTHSHTHIVIYVGRHAA